MGLLNGARLKLYFAVLRQFHRFQRTKHAFFKYCVDCLHRFEYGAFQPEVNVSGSVQPD